MRPRGSQKTLEKRRRWAMQLLDEGLQPVEVARRVGVARRSVRRWKAAHRNDGDQGIRAKPVPGRPCKLGPEQRAQLEEILLRGATSAGFPTDLWTCPRVAALIRGEFGVRYHVDHIGRLLHCMGWSAQKPQRKAIERDEERIRRWVKQEWPRVKKTPRN